MEDQRLLTTVLAEQCPYFFFSCFHLRRVKMKSHNSFCSIISVNDNLGISVCEVWKQQNHGARYCSYQNTLSRKHNNNKKVWSSKARLIQKGRSICHQRSAQPNLPAPPVWTQFFLHFTTWASLKRSVLTNLLSIVSLPCLISVFRSLWSQITIASIQV